ncbi:protein RKD4 [Cucurbita maxima]|uniref:Protein RKD4 n=1 Tax=Cucurbita maxima TaxID=3661 RepID=A0A6J1HU37_CUCMA|nr:protein RKD4 [Cucurbita maxima]
MEPSTKLHPHDFDFGWPYHQHLFPFDHEALELPPLDVDGSFDFNSLSLPFHWDDISELESEILSLDKHMIPVTPLYEEDMVAVDETKPERMVKLKDDDMSRELQEVTRMIETGLSNWKEEEEECEKRVRLIMRNGRRKSSVLGLEEIQKHFHIPITEAAKAMSVGLTVLKRRCRELNIMRWPHRKLKSLNSLITNVQEMGLTNEIKGLEEHKRLVEELPNMDLTHRTRRLRQACFKANYKKKRRSNVAVLH